MAAHVEKTTTQTETLGILPLQDAVLFPNTVIPLAVVKKPGIVLVEEALREGRQIGLVALKDKDTENPGPDDVRSVGTVGTIQKMLKVPDGTLRCIVAGSSVFKIDRFTQSEPYLAAVVRETPTSRSTPNSRSRCTVISPASSRSCWAICLRHRARWRWKSTTSPTPIS